jgi:DNA-binding FadR family transcriptional regulator
MNRQLSGTGYVGTADHAASASGDGGPAGGRLFTTVSLGRASQAIVEQIRALLHDGRIAPGDRLPSERELCEQFGVSRVTVREALRILETGGLISIKVGAHGGTFVTSPTSGRVADGLADLITLSPLTAAEVTEARLVFELGIVPLIVDRATPADIAELRRMTDEHLAAMKAGKYTMEMSADFHTAAAACTHNQAITMLVQSFHGPLLMSLLEAKNVAPVMGRTGVTEHVAFIDAIALRDVAKARDIMSTHVLRTAKRVGKASSSDRRK